MPVQPYLFFDGSCEDALEFYQRAVGAKVEMLMRYKESPEPPPPGMVPPGYGEKVMHSSIRIGDGLVLAADDCTGKSSAFSGFSLALSAPDEPTARRQFQALAEGGEVTAPLAKTFFSPAFGMLRDRFGVRWMVMASA